MNGPKFMTTNLIKIQEEINRELANKDVFNALVVTTFKGINQNLIKRALMEGMMRGYTFKDFLEKNIYAIPFGKDGYALVTSVDDARKRGMRSGVVGKKKIISCSVTIKRKVNEYVGDYTATVYFDEYFKAGRNGYPSLWEQKPRTMIAKVAEMHALRMACPEELAQTYIEEEMDKEKVTLIENQVKNQPTSEKGKIVFLLKTLKKDVSTPEKTKETIKEVTGMDVADDNLVEIRSKLEAIVLEKNENA
jgi:hypothetical protein